MTPKNKHPGTLLCRAALAFLITIASNISWGQATAPAPLPPAAQEAVDKGIIAAKVPDFLLAIRYFEEARKAATQAPVVYLNLGLAESRIPGRELRAMAWFGAYLSAYPDAPNAAAVREQIAVLGVKNQSNVSRFVKTVQDAASQLSGDDKDLALVYVAGLWAEAGDHATALQTAELMQGRKNQAQAEIAKAQAKTGDIPGAKRTADLVRNAMDKSNAQRVIAEAQTSAGDAAGALKTLAAALDTASLIPNAISKSDEQANIAKTQIKAGDIPGAQKTAGLIQDVFYKIVAYQYIAVAQAESGDTASAQQTLASAQEVVDLSREASRKSDAQSILNQTKAMLPLYQRYPRRSTPEIRSQETFVVKASDWLGRLDDGNKSSDCPLNTGPFLDLTGYLKSLPPATYAAHVFDGLRKTAAKIIKAQNVITRMLKRQTQQ